MAEYILVSDPDVCGGRLTVRGHGITGATLAARWLAGESFTALAKDYSLTRRVVERALQEWFARANRAPRG